MKKDTKLGLFIMAINWIGLTMLLMVIPCDNLLFIIFGYTAIAFMCLVPIVGDYILEEGDFKKEGERTNR